jgi:uncharacterized membrane protein
MGANIVGLFFVLVGFGISTISAVLSLYRWRQLEAQLFKELAVSFLLFLIICLVYLFPPFYIGRSAQDLV